MKLNSFKPPFPASDTIFSQSDNFTDNRNDHLRNSISQHSSEPFLQLQKITIYLHKTRIHVHNTCITIAYKLHDCCTWLYIKLNISTTRFSDYFINYRREWVGDKTSVPIKITWLFRRPSVISSDAFEHSLVELSPISTTLSTVPG